MGVSVTIPQERPGLHQVFCLACRFDLGTMMTETIVKAIKARGSIICPECRERHCDYCGFIRAHHLPLTRQRACSPGWRICPTCVREQRATDPPAFSAVVKMTSELELATDEALFGSGK